MNADSKQEATGPVVETFPYDRPDAAKRAAAQYSQNGWEKFTVEQHGEEWVVRGQAPNPQNVGAFVVVGANYWGRGCTVAEAKANFRKQGGRLGNGYNVFKFDAETEFRGVDDFGRVHYRSTQDMTRPNDPEVTEHPPRGAR